MPGPVYRGASIEPVAVWKEGKLLDKDGDGTLWSRRGIEWFPGKAATGGYRQQGNTWFKGASAEPYWRLVQGHVLRGNTYEVVYRVSGEKLCRPGSVEAVFRGEGLSPEELVTAALLLEGR